METLSCGAAALVVYNKDRERENMTKSKINPGEVVGIIGDTHLPYENPDYLEFCKETFKANKVNRVIHIGDLFDNHALSFHDSEPCLRGSRGEYELVKERVKPWYKAFPNVQLIRGNHDKIPGRQLKTVGLDPDTYLRPMAEVYGFPEGWSEVDYVFSNGVLYHHGETAVADFGYAKDARNRMCNTVTGHAHGNAGVGYTATDHRLVWGMGVGCGIDAKSMAFAYGKNFKRKPILGVGIVSCDGTFPQYVPMDLGTKP